MPRWSGTRRTSYCPLGCRWQSSIVCCSTETSECYHGYHGYHGYRHVHVCRLVAVCHLNNKKVFDESFDVRVSKDYYYNLSPHTLPPSLPPSLPLSLPSSSLPLSITVLCSPSPPTPSLITCGPMPRSTSWCSHHTTRPVCVISGGRYLLLWQSFIDRNVWKIYLDQENFELAKKYADVSTWIVSCRYSFSQGSQRNLDTILVRQAESNFKKGRYEDAAIVFSESHLFVWGSCPQVHPGITHPLTHPLTHSLTHSISPYYIYIILGQQERSPKTIPTS